jgi:hypothetical protein
VEVSWKFLLAGKLNELGPFVCYCLSSALVSFNEVLDRVNSWTQREKGTVQRFSVLVSVLEGLIHALVSSYRVNNKDERSSLSSSVTSHFSKSLGGSLDLIHSGNK